MGNTFAAVDVDLEVSTLEVSEFALSTLPLVLHGGYPFSAVWETGAAGVAEANFVLSTFPLVVLGGYPSLPPVVGTKFVLSTFPLVVLGG